MAKVITVGFSGPFRPLVDMSHIRWFSISQELANLGHDVDIATGDPVPRWGSGKIQLGPRLRRVSLGKVRWEDYDVVKTVYQRGFETLEQHGGASHPFIVARMSGIVAEEDRPGIYFTGDRRRWLHKMQLRIAARSAAVSLTTAPAVALWEKSFGASPRALLVPGAAATEIPAPRRDPYPGDVKYRCLLSGNIFDRGSQKDANEHLSRSLSSLGEILARRNIGLFVLGSGDTSLLDRKHVTHLGVAPYADSWDYFYHASVGIALQWGEHLNQNELTKIYYYLRAGLPVVAQSGFPNEGLIEETGMGFVVPNGDLHAFADKIEIAARSTQWPRKAAADWIARHHTWRNRAEIYHRFFQERNLPVARGKSAPDFRPSFLR